MATRRFCDICDNPLKPSDDAPLVRVLEYIPGPDKVWPESEKKPQAFAYVAITNEHNHPLTDICIGCKLHIVMDGQPAPKITPIATLQPQVPSDANIETPFYKLSENPPQVPKPETPPTPIIFEPSLPSRKLPEQQSQ